MINVRDAVPIDGAKLYRWEVVNSDGSSKDPPEYQYLAYAPGELANDPTPINRATLMALQGFVAATTEFLLDGNIRETNGDGDIKLTEFLSDGSIKETLTGATGEILIKTTIFNADGSITEVIS